MGVGVCIGKPGLPCVVPATRQGCAAFLIETGAESLIGTTLGTVIWVLTRPSGTGTRGRGTRVAGKAVLWPAVRLWVTRTSRARVHREGPEKARWTGPGIARSGPVTGLDVWLSNQHRTGSDLGLAY